MRGVHPPQTEPAPVAAETADTSPPQAFTAAMISDFEMDLHRQIMSSEAMVSRLRKVVFNVLVPRLQTAQKQAARAGVQLIFKKEWRFLDTPEARPLSPDGTLKAKVRPMRLAHIG